MNWQDFDYSIMVNISAREAFEKICHVYEWWTVDFEGSARNLHDVFIARWRENFIQVEIAEIIPDKKIVWLVTDCYFPWLQDETEWKDTSMVFEISPQGNKTHIHFTHVGLVPEIECYGTCKVGWSAYIGKSLFQLLTQGKGLPATLDGEEIVFDAAAS